MNSIFTTSFFLLFFAFGFAQPYIEGGNTRHRFAQLTLGITNQYYSGQQTKSFKFNTSGILEPFQLKDQFQTQLIIGGTHFWGHADFYVTIPVFHSSKNGFRSIGETAFKYYPWRIESHKFRPFIGFLTQTGAFKQGEGVDQVKFSYPLISGFTFNFKRSLIELTATYNFNSKRDYYISMHDKVGINAPKIMASISYKIYLETTLGAEKNWQSGHTKKMTDTLVKLHRLNGFTLGIAPSASFFLKRNSPHNSEIAPYLGQHRMSKVYLELAAGYYWHRPDLQANFTFRTVKSDLLAYNYSQKTKRNSFTLELYKFIGDYHGFAPFVGPAISYEKMKVSDVNQIGINDNHTFEGIKPGLTFGWDIRPNRIQSWYLRTNLRWFPNLNVNMASGKNVALDQLEINFIEFVFFPSKFF